VAEEHPRCEPWSFTVTGNVVAVFPLSVAGEGETLQTAAVGAPVQVSETWAG